MRAIQEDDLRAIERWFEEAALAAFEGRSLDELLARRSRERALRAIILEGENEPIGLLEYEVTDGWLGVPFIALAKPYRGWGYGSEAVRLVEEWAVREGIAKRFRALVDVRNGLGLYFWLRLGYRPAAKGEIDWQRTEARDKMPMVREVTPVGSTTRGR